MKKSVQEIKELKKATANLKTVSNYAKAIKSSRATVYNMIEDKRVQSIEIDGVKFISL